MRRSEDSIAAFDRIAIALRQVGLDVQKVLDDIDNIAKEQMNKLDEDSPEHQAWYAFSGLGPFSDVGRGRLALLDHFAAIRGWLIYRGLDPNAKTLTPEELNRE